MGGSDSDRTHLRFCNLLLPRDVISGLKIDPNTGQVTFFVGSDFQVRPELQTNIPLDQIEVAMKAFAAGQDFVVPPVKKPPSSPPELNPSTSFQIGDKVVAHDKFRNWFEGVVKSIPSPDKYEIQFDGWRERNNFIQSADTIRRKITGGIYGKDLRGANLIVRIQGGNGQCKVVTEVYLDKNPCKISDIMAIL